MSYVSLEKAGLCGLHGAHAILTHANVTGQEHVFTIQIRVEGSKTFFTIKKPTYIFRYQIKSRVGCTNKV